VASVKSQAAKDGNESRLSQVSKKAAYQLVKQERSKSPEDQHDAILKFLNLL
jgi:hypothetical protein